MSVYNPYAFSANEPLQQYGYPSFQQSIPTGGFRQQQFITTPPTPAGATIPGTPTGFPSAPPPFVPGQLPLEQSFIENILRLNVGKIGTFYMTYENNSQWNAKIFKGKVEAAGRDHIIISDPKTGMRFLLLMINLDYVTFDEPINYSYPITQRNS